MSIQSISKLILLAAIVAAAAHFSTTTTALAGILGSRCLDQTGCSLRCPACDHVCKLDAEQVEESKVCFDVETKVVCIPRVVFPWQKKKCKSCSSCDGNGCSHCVNNGARTRKVCVLKPSSYKCPACKYTWSAEKRDGCSGGCAAGQCACDAPPAEPTPEPIPANPTPANPTTDGALPPPTAYGPATPSLLPKVGTLPPWLR